MRGADAIIVSIPRSEHTVLVVDDHEAKRYVTTRILNKAGFKTVEAASGQMAMEIAVSNVSAVVLDVHLPDIDGFEVCARLRGNPKTANLPIVHLSAVRIEDADKVEGLNAGADGYLVHPVEPAMLVATIQALIRARMAEDRHRHSEQKFRAIYTQAQGGIALVDAEGRFHDVNPALLKMLKREYNEVINRSISEFAAPADQELIRMKTTTTTTSYEMWNDEFPLLNASGEFIFLKWSMSPYVENDLRVAVITNISERIHLETQRNALLEREKAARQTAEKHIRTKDDFIAILSHELRNPLTSIMLNVHLLSRMELPQVAAKSLELIRKSANTQSTIISDLLDVARINSGKLHLVRETSDPVALISSSIESMKVAIEQKSIHVALDTTNFRLESMSLDPTRFQQIFWNIFNNAVKFSNSGGAIHVTLTHSENVVTLVVRDFGKGIEADFLVRIFDRFSQREQPGSRSHGGLGLGLSIVKNLVEMHGGHIAITSDGPGTGVRVEVEFPIEKSSNADSDTKRRPLEVMRFLNRPHILLVEDDCETASMLALILEDCGAQVMLANDYETAMKIIAETPPTLLISDIGLPGKDGYELIRDIRKREKNTIHLPAIALTAFGRESDRLIAHEAGFDTHLLKPLEPHILLNIIHELLDVVQ